MIELPRRKRGRQSRDAAAEYEGALTLFCSNVRQIRSTLDFPVSSRGWCYVLEEHGLSKSDFDVAQTLINDCRRSGLLPLDICADDGARSFDNLEDLDDGDPEGAAAAIVNSIGYQHEYYTPISFWHDQPVYIEMLVEKVDLKSLFTSVCAWFKIPVANGGGWTDLNIRAEMMRRFAQWEQRGKKCVLLYCGDLDPGGLAISGTLRSNLQDLAAAVGWSPDDLIIDRFGLNADFVEAQGLTWIDNLATAKGEFPLDDPRQDYLRLYGVRKVEANALVVRPEAGRALCRAAILQYVADDAPARYREALAPHRERLRTEILGRLLALYSGGAA